MTAGYIDCGAKFVRSTRRYRTITIRADTQTLTAQDPLPSELRDALEQII